MQDLTIALDNRPGALAEMGAALGRKGVSIEGGGAWVVSGQGIAHFLFTDGDAARAALEEAGIRVVGVRDVLVQRLNQSRPGQLGVLTQRMADAGVNIEVLYSDHNYQLILVVDDIERGRQVSEQWTPEQAAIGCSQSPKSTNTREAISIPVCERRPTSPALRTSSGPLRVCRAPTSFRLPCSTTCCSARRRSGGRSRSRNRQRRWGCEGERPPRLYRSGLWSRKDKCRGSDTPPCR